MRKPSSAAEDRAERRKLALLQSASRLVNVSALYCNSPRDFDTAISTAARAARALLAKIEESDCGGPALTSAVK